MMIQNFMPSVGLVIVWTIIIGALALLLTPKRLKGYATVAVICGAATVFLSLNNFPFVQSCYNWSQLILGRIIDLEIMSPVNRFFFPYGLLIAVGGIGAMCGILMAQLVAWRIRRRVTVSRE
jgi:hypothetical protein